MVVDPEPGGDRLTVRSQLKGEFDLDQGFDGEDGDAEDGDGVGAEDQPGEGKPLPYFGLAEVPDIDQPVKQSEEHRGPACAEEDVGAGPEIFVDGEAEVPEGSGGK